MSEHYTFRVRVSAEQAERWQAAAEYEGARAVSAWLATLASARLRELGRWVPRMPLHWRRASFRVLECPNGEEVAREASGIVAGPFGIHKDAHGEFHLVHTPTGCHLIALPKQGRCKTLACELAMCKVNWSASVPEEVTGPENDRVASMLTVAQRAAQGPPD